MSKILTKLEIEKLDLPESDKRFALMMFATGADVRLAGETEDGYTLTYSFLPDTSH